MTRGQVCKYDIENYTINENQFVKPLIPVK